MTNILITGGRIIDPAQGLDWVGDLLISDGLIKGVERSIEPPDNVQIVDADGMVVCPGFIDIHCHLRDPWTGVQRDHRLRHTRRREGRLHDGMRDAEY